MQPKSTGLVPFQLEESAKILPGILACFPVNCIYFPENSMIFCLDEGCNPHSREPIGIQCVYENSETISYLGKI